MKRKILVILTPAVLALTGCTTTTDPVTGKVTHSLTPATQATLDRIETKALAVGVAVAEKELDKLAVKASGK